MQPKRPWPEEAGHFAVVEKQFEVARKQQYLSAVNKLRNRWTACWCYFASHTQNNAHSHSPPHHKHPRLHRDNAHWRILGFKMLCKALVSFFLSSLDCFWKWSASPNEAGDEKLENKMSVTAFPIQAELCTLSVGRVMRMSATYHLEYRHREQNECSLTRSALAHFDKNLREHPFSRVISARTPKTRVRVRHEDV